ncbi:MAG: enoyl-CoA hydratase/isomerase family protein [Promethearchaeota archaeon]
MKNYETIKIEERDDGISIITFTRPERLNAMSFQYTEDMLDYLNTLEDNFTVRVLILTGEGRGFSSGLDLKESQLIYKKKVPEDFKKFKYLTTVDLVKRSFYAQKKLSKVMLKLRKIPQPIIAAVNGPAYGGGLGLTLAADIRIASESAIFCNAFIKIGVSGADMASSYWLPRLIGFSRAAEFMYTGRDMNAREAEKYGLVSRVVPDNELLNEALKTAKMILNKSPLGVKLTKEALNINIDAPSLEAAIEFENRTQVICLNTKDALEGAFSLLAKKEPKYDEW